MFIMLPVNAPLMIGGSHSQGITVSVRNGPLCARRGSRTRAHSTPHRISSHKHALSFAPIQFQCHPPPANVLRLGASLHLHTILSAYLRHARFTFLALRSLSHTSRECHVAIHSHGHAYQPPTMPTLSCHLHRGKILALSCARPRMLPPPFPNSAQLF